MTALAAKRFTASEVADATGVRPEKQYQWEDRGITVPSRKDKRSSGSGDPSLKSIETVYQIAITAALVRLGVTAKLAARGAFEFRTDLFQDRCARPCRKDFDFSSICPRSDHGEQHERDCSQLSHDPFT